MTTMTTPSLSPDPAKETNYLLRVLITKLDNAKFPSVPELPSQGKDPISVRANCLLYSSLCCSILAAVGAMLAKEWLQSFERGGQMGPIHEQVLRRQHKFNGMRQWLLEPMRLALSSKSASTSQSNANPTIAAAAATDNTKAIGTRSEFGKRPAAAGSSKSSLYGKGFELLDNGTLVESLIEPFGSPSLGGDNTVFESRVKRKGKEIDRETLQVD
ncbi:hypothetical protein FRC01_009339, partial [Tulasnella sp. 417]